MSALHTIPRNAVRLGLAVATAPARALGAPPLVDRLDAELRGTAGRLLGDDVLREEATRKRAAADARDTARDLDDDAAEREARAREVEEERRAAGARAADRRKEAAAEAADRRREAAAAEARRERLHALSEKEAALDDRAEAQDRADEADALAKAVAGAKAARKSG